MSSYLPVPGTTEPAACLGCGRPFVSENGDDIKYVAVILAGSGEEGKLHDDEACIQKFIEDCIAQAE